MTAYIYDKQLNDEVISVMQALRKEPMTVYGDGKQTRSFQFVSDLVCAFQPKCFQLSVVAPFPDVGFHLMVSSTT